MAESKSARPWILQEEKEMLIKMAEEKEQDQRLKAQVQQQVKIEMGIVAESQRAQVEKQPFEEA